MQGWFVAAFAIVGGQACGAQVEGAGDAPGTLSYGNHPQQVVSAGALVPTAPLLGASQTGAPQTGASQAGSVSDPAHAQGTPGDDAAARGLASSASTSAAITSVAQVASAAAPEPQRLEVGAGQLSKDECRVWLDVAESEIAPTDLSVKFSEEVWPSVDLCGEQPGWTLLRDTAGVWLQLCAFSCQLVALAPESVLAIESTYRTQPLHQAR